MKRIINLINYNMEERNIGIYKITNNVNGKVYIGETRKLLKRENQYKFLGCKGQPKIYNSIKKYGWENFTFEVLEYCSIEDLKSLEYQYHKFYYDVLGKDMMLNLRAGGGGQNFVSDETRKKIGDGNKGEKSYMLGKKGEECHNFGRKHTEESKIKMSEAKKGEKSWHFGKKGEEHPMFGKRHTDETKLKMSELHKDKKHSEETKKKMSETQKNRPREKTYKKISQFTKDGIFIKHFNSVKEAGKELCITKCNISSCLTGKSKSTGGFTWKYFEE